MHRSGTSLLAGTLEAAGVYLGAVNDTAPHNKKGNRENERLRDINEAIFRRIGAHWKTPPAPPVIWSPEERRLIESELEQYRGRKIWGFKDPRAIWLVEGYLDLFPDARLIGIFRHPGAVAASLAARSGSLHMSTAEGRKLWLKTNSRLLDLWLKHRFPIAHFTDYGPADPAFVEPVSVFLRDLGLKENVDEFFDRSLVHQTSEITDLSFGEQSVLEELIAAVNP